MLDQEFTQYLTKVFPQEYVDFINLCRENLYNLGFSLVESKLYLAIPEYQDIDILTSKMSFEQYLIDGFTLVLDNYGIRYNERDLLAYNTILTCLVNLENSSHSKEIMEILDNDEFSLTETIEQLFFLVSTENDIATYILNLEVDDGLMFLYRIREIHQEKATATELDEIPEDEIPEKYKLRLRKFMQEFPDSIITRYYNDDMLPLGKTWNDYYRLLEEDIRLLYPSQPQLVIIEFYGMCICANTPFYEIGQLIKKTVYDTYKDLSFTSKVNIGVDKFLQGRESE